MRLHVLYYVTCTNHLICSWAGHYCYLVAETHNRCATFFFFETYILFPFLLDSFLCSEPKLYVIVAVFNDINKGHIPKCWELLQLALLVNSAVCNFVILPILFHFNIPLQHGFTSILFQNSIIKILRNTIHANHILCTARKTKQRWNEFCHMMNHFSTVIWHITPNSQNIHSPAPSGKMDF